LLTGVNFETINFANLSSVTFGGVPSLQISYYSDSLIGVYPSTGATGYIKVSNPVSSDSLGVFTYIISPFINSFTPNTATSGDTILIRGNNFNATTEVKFGTVSAGSFTVLSDTTIKAIVGNGATGDVEVYTNYGYSVKPGFTYLSKPLIYSFSPTSATKGTLVTINGDYFTNTTEVKFGGVAADSFFVISPQQINAYVGNGASGNIIVKTTVGADSMAGFTFIAAPIISSFTPTSAKTGDTVTINGNNFTNINSIRFGNVTAASYTIITPSVLKAVVGLGTSGYVKINTAGGVDSLAGFTYLTPPAINSFTPSTGDSGTIVTITGIHFNGATAVSFGGTTAISFTVITDGIITAVVGNGTTGNITVTTPQGTSSLGTFTVFPYLNTVDLNLCANGNTTIISNFSGVSYQWQVDAGSGFTNISNNATYTGATTNTLHLNSIPSAWYGYKYRCFINSSFYSRQTVIKFSNTWTGAVSTAWGNPANWSCGTVPDANTDVVITSGSIIVTSNVVVRSLTLNPGVSFTVTSPNTITLLASNSAIGNLGGTPGNCTPFVISGTYNQDVALNASNTIQIQVNVTTIGPYAIAITNTASGVNFYKAGTFTSTGLQTITLLGSGVPGLSGNQNYTVSFGASNCTFTINFIGVPPSYVPTTVNSNWSYAATSTPDPVDSLYKISLPSFVQFNGQTFKDFSEINEFGLDHNSGYRKSGGNYYFYYNHFEDLHSLLFLQAHGEIKQLDENALVGGTWFSDITGWVNGGSTNTPIRVQGTVLDKGVSVSLPTGLNFTNVIKVKLNFYDMTIPSSPGFVYSEERWFAFGVGLIYYKSTDLFGTGITYQLKRYQIN
jgi:IPT/TIG domain